MEPLDGYLFWDGESVKARYGCQIQTLDHKQLCDLFELPPDKVQIETILAGGSFGRRIDLGNPTLGPDLAADMAAAAKGIGPGHGVKVVWTREDDIRNGWYRPMILHRLRGAIRGGKVVGWTDTVVGHSWTRHSAMDALVVNGLDQMMVEGASEVSYTFEAFRCDAHIVPGKVPTTSLRSVASTHTGHAVESFIDQLLQETGQDPVEGRLALMGDAPRAAGVLRAVAKAADWQGAKVVDGRARRGRRQGVRYLCGAGGRGLDRRRRYPESAQGVVRGGLRRSGEPRRDPRADRGRHRLRPEHGVVRQYHAERRRGRTVQFQ